MSLDLSKFQESFFEESGEHVAVMEEGLLALEQRPGDLDLLNRIFRAAHSIKGNSGMFGFAAVGGFTHKLENILDALRNGQMAVTKPLIDLLLEATDALKGLLEAARTNTPPDEAVVGPLRARLQACVEGNSPSPSPSPLKGEGQSIPSPLEGEGKGEGDLLSRRHYDIAWTPPPDLFQRGMDPGRLLDELAGLGDVTNLKPDVGRLPDLIVMDPERCYLSWTLSLETDRPAEDIESVFEFVKDDGVLTIEEHNVSSPSPCPSPLKGEGQSIPSPLEGEGKGEGDNPGPQRLGEILVAEGLVAPETLAGALSQQKRLGEILVEQKVVTPRQVAQALDKQQSQEKAAAGRKVESASIRVDTEKIDRLINLVGELVITQSMLSDLSSRFEVEQLPVLRERVAQLEHNTRELQERIMSIRMLPIGTAFNRFPRLVRDLAAHNGKKIQLVLSGEETELDKTVIESIGDPLTHLVRNSADHGLELPEERCAAGKPEQGTIRLNAFHEGGNICITVEDDGRGLNRDKILAKAATQGLITESDRLTDDQVWALIFRPGFSTADTITDVSGRGVGMDVVKRNIDGLGGTVSIRTAPGRGATFTLKLPLTLAIIEGMTVRVGPELYIVPLVSIVESVQPKPGAVKTIVERGEVVNVRGSYVPVIRLSGVFGIASEVTDPSKGILVILETEGEQVAVLVDELVGQQQVVVKSLEQNFQKVDGFAGATILGDGTVGFILDVRGLLDLARRGDVVAA